jgi:hypothetical protein
MKKIIPILAFLLACCAPAAFAESVTDTDCGACHVKQTTSADKEGTLAFTHGKMGLKDCALCHKKADLVEKHKNVKPGEKKFVQARRYGPEMCQSCHGTLADVAKRTKHPIKDKAGREANPHALPAVEAHEKLVQCSMCHRVHKQQPDVQRDCIGCHHTGEFVCKGCHDQKG